MPDDNGEERWLPIEGYVGLYEVSDYGRVRSLDRLVLHGRSGTMIRLSGRLLRPATRVGGRLTVSLSLNGAERSCPVHKLVAEAFLGRCPVGMEVLHGPGGAYDNRLDNLSYGTHTQNIQDKQRDGTDHKRNRTRCPRKHLLEAPNLRACDARHGRRSCLACSRAMGNLQTAKRRGVELDLQTESDRHYAAIMEGADGSSLRYREGA